MNSRLTNRYLLNTHIHSEKFTYNKMYELILLELSSSSRLILQFVICNLFIYRKRTHANENDFHLMRMNIYSPYTCSLSCKLFVKEKSWIFFGIYNIYINTLNKTVPKLRNEIFYFLPPPSPERNAKMATCY